MTRTYINGVSKLSFNNGLVSFTLNDTKPDNTGDAITNPVIEVITDPKTLHGICSFICEQLNSTGRHSGSSKINQASDTSAGLEKSEIKSVSLTVGKKIASSDMPHN